MKGNHRRGTSAPGTPKNLLSGGMKGNQNAKKGSDWRNAIKRAIERIGEDDYEAGLDKAADEFVAAVLERDMAAIRELGDRIDGKPVQKHAADEDNNGEKSRFFIIGG